MSQGNLFEDPDWAVDYDAVVVPRRVPNFGVTMMVLENNSSYFVLPDFEYFCSIARSKQYDPITDACEGELFGIKVLFMKGGIKGPYFKISSADLLRFRKAITAEAFNYCNRGKLISSCVLHTYVWRKEEWSDEVVSFIHDVECVGVLGAINSETGENTFNAYKENDIYFQNLFDSFKWVATITYKNEYPRKFEKVTFGENLGSVVISKVRRGVTINLLGARRLPADVLKVTVSPKVTK